MKTKEPQDSLEAPFFKNTSLSDLRDGSSSLDVSSDQKGNCSINLTKEDVNHENSESVKYYAI